MYDFSSQEKMLNAAVLLLKDKNLLEKTSFGGGTLLSAYYWNHRYSTDIDMFLYTEENILMSLREAAWSKNVKDHFTSLGYNMGSMKNNGIYLEFKINEDMKVQFLDSSARTVTPYYTGSVFGQELNIETINEIIAKKIFFRGHEATERDVFDIAVALHKNPSILDEIDLPIEKLKGFHESVHKMACEAKERYLSEIEKMTPSSEYKELADNAPEYLENFLNDYLYFKIRGQDIKNEDLVELENDVYNEVVLKIESDEEIE